MKDLQIIKHELIMNRNSLSAEADLFIDDKLIKTVECRSFVDGFLRRLYAQAGGDEPNHATPAATDSFGGLIKNITAVTGAGVGITITVDTLFDDDLPIMGDRVFISGVGGNTAANNTEANPYWRVTPGIPASKQYALWDSMGNGAYTSGGICVFHGRKLAGKGRDALAFRVNAPVNNDLYGMLIGTGSTAVKMWDRNMVTKVANGTAAGQLLYSAITFGAPTIFGNDAYFTITRSFTNNSLGGGHITIKELGLTSFFNTPIHPSASGVFYHILSRDVTGDVQILNGKTLVVNYRVKVTLGTEGGFLRQMIELLYRQFTQTAVNAQTVWNTSNSVGASIDQLNMNELHLGMSSNGDQTLDRGIVVGTDNTAVSLSDYAMLGRINHGDALGQLFHFLSVVGSYVENVVGGYCQLDVFRIFENKSGSSIIVRENGIYAFGSGTALHCVARHKLTTPITVVANGLLKVIYTLKVIG